MAGMDDDTIFAVSSGRLPAAIAVIRVSGDQAAAVMVSLIGRPAPARTPVLRALCGADGTLLDRALVLWFPGPANATGEDLLELHCHGGRAVVTAVERAVADVPGVRAAVPGEFTRRALLNGRIDLAQAEGLGDLLSAETETQRRVALQAVEGAISREINGWMGELSELGALLELSIDHDDGDTLIASDVIQTRAERLCVKMRNVLSQPPVERYRDGIRVVLAGPRNAGKSSLFNALIDREAAIASPIAGTTRDTIEAGVTRHGSVFVFSDTAGLIDWTDDVIEGIGVERARAAIRDADILLWLGQASVQPDHPAAIVIHARYDLPERTQVPSDADLATSVSQPQTVQALWSLLQERADRLTPSPDRPLLHRRHRECAAAALATLETLPADSLLAAEHVRLAARSLANLLGQNPTEAMLDALFKGFCLGK